MGFYGDNGQENGNYCNDIRVILGLYMFEKHSEATVSGKKGLGFRAWG